MAFGSKKNKKGSKGAKENAVQEVKAKPSESLGTVLSESVPAASLDIIRTNDVFHVASKDANGNSCYVVATLDVADIGGLNKHMKSDPDKGQFIECISNGNIQAHVSEEGIEAGKFVIIPTATSIQSMSEFSFIADSNKFSKFIPTYVWVDGNGNMTFEETEARVPFSWFGDIIKNRISIDDAVEIMGTGSAPEGAAVEGYDAPAQTEEAAYEEDADMTSEASYDEEPNFGDDYAPEMPQEDVPVQEYAEEPVQEPVQEQYTEPVQSYEEPVQSYEESAAYAGEQTGANMVECPSCHAMMDMDYPCPSCGYSFNSYIGEEAPAATPDDSQVTIREVSYEETLAACERLFHAGDLDLQITTQPFDMQFIQGNAYVPIPENREDGWLNRYVTQMVKSANAELERLHNHNLFLARDRYISIMTDECEKIAAKVDIDDSTNEYYKIRSKIIDEASAKKNNLEMEVDRRRSDMKEEWDREMAQICESAAAAAKRTYIDRNNKSHEEALRRVESELIDAIEVDYQKSMTELNNERKKESKRLLDIAVTATLIASSQEYQKMLAEEEEARKEILDKIQAFIDEHRKDEVARMQTLDEKQRQKDEASKVTDEFTRKIHDLTAEHEAACSKLKNEVAAAQAHETTIKNECALKIEAYETKEKELNAKFDELMDNYVSLDARKAKEYEGRMTMLENDKKAAEEHLAHVDAIHNKYNKVSIIVWVAIACATFAIGTLVGAKFLSTPTVSGGQYSISLTTDETQNEAPVEVESETTAQ